MSLTSLIKSDKELRDKIRAAFSRPKLEKNQPLLAGSRTKRYGVSWYCICQLIGYLFLFNIQDLIDDIPLQKFTEWFERKIRSNS